jgi:hypothetical protein
VEGQTRRLTGTAEARYQEWRRLLREIYSAETGIALPPVAEPAAAAAPDGAPVDGAPVEAAGGSESSAAAPQ